MKISLFAASIRPHFWNRFLDSLKSNTYDYEVVFTGFIDDALVKEFTDQYKEFRYIRTGDVKPAQCYEIARRACKGLLVGWCSDDCTFSEGALDKIYNFSIHQPYQTVIAIKNVDPECENNDLNTQRFFPRNLNTPQMAVTGFMHRGYLDKLGGFDRRYVYGKFESDLCMRVLSDGGKIIKYEDVTINIEHTMKNGDYTNDWSGVNQDSETLENSWVIGGYKEFEKPIVAFEPSGKPVPYYPITNREVTLKRNDVFEPYDYVDILNKSQSINTRWI